jgi:hypothetical protein
MAVALFKGSKQRGIVVVVIAAVVLLRLITEFVPSLLGNSRLSLSSGTISTLQKNNHKSSTTITTTQEQRLPPQDEQKAIARSSNDTGTNSSAPNVTVMALPTDNDASVTPAASSPPLFPLVRERMPEKNTFHQWDFESFLHGPGLTEGRLASTNHSACEYVKHWPNFAHVWQQLYSCFSWWHANLPEKRPMLVYGEPLGKGRGYTEGLLNVLIEEIGLEVVRQVNHSILPVVQRKMSISGHRFRNKSDAEALTKLVARHHNVSLSSCGTQVRIGLLNRGSTRSLQNGNEIIAALNTTFGTQASINLINFDGKSFLEQFEFMASTDVLLSPHGAQLTSVLFMPECARLNEIDPVGYLVPYFFGTLAHVSGVHHSFIYMGKPPGPERDTEVGHKTRSERVQARKKHMAPDVPSVVHVVREMVDEWRQCCADDSS